MFIEVEKLIVWQKAHQLTLDIYKLTAAFPKHELYGLVSQMQRAATSVPCNISEGKARNSTNDYLRFLTIARGSLEELRYQLLLSKDLSYIDKTHYERLNSSTVEIRKLLNGLIRSLKTK